MIKNNLNIAQQVNCSGISSSLFLFFDSKILCSGYLIQQSHPRWGPGPSSIFLCVLYHNRGQGDTTRCHFHISHICCKAFPACSGAELHGTAPFPQNLSELKRKNRIKEMTNPLPAIKTGSTRQERWKPVPAWSLLKPKGFNHKSLCFQD